MSSSKELFRHRLDHWPFLILVSNVKLVISSLLSAGCGVEFVLVAPPGATSPPHSRAAPTDAPTRTASSWTRLRHSRPHPPIARLDRHRERNCFRWQSVSPCISFRTLPLFRHTLHRSGHRDPPGHSLTASPPPADSTSPARVSAVPVLSAARSGRGRFLAPSVG